MENIEKPKPVDKITITYKIILGILALIFLGQTFNLFNVIPTDKALALTGQNNTAAIIFLSIFLSFALYFAINVILDFLYSAFLNEEIYEKQGIKFLSTFIIAFFTTWISFFTYGLLIAFKVFPNNFGNEFLNYYLFWFIILRIGVIQYKSKKQNESQFEIQKLTDNRITWFKQLFIKETTDLNKSEYGEIIFKQGKAAKIIILIACIFILPNIAAIISVIIMLLQLPVTPVEASIPLKAIFLVFVIAAGFNGLYAIGILLSKGIVIYKNAIKISLPVIKDSPVFTLILPKSSIIIPVQNIKSCNIKNRYYGRVKGMHNRQKISVLEIYLKDGRKIKNTLFVMKPQEIEEKINSIIK